MARNDVLSTELAEMAVTDGKKEGTDLVHALEKIFHFVSSDVNVLLTQASNNHLILPNLAGAESKVVTPFTARLETE